MTTADINASLAFLQRWNPKGPWVLTAISPDKRFIRTRTFKPRQEKALRAFLTEHGDAKRNVYFHVNSVMRVLGKKAEREDIASVDWLHVDVDPDPGEDLESEQQRILALLQKHPGLPPPTVIIFSGGGYQAYWKLAEPIPINGNEEAAEDAKRYNLQIELLLGADSCHNIDRIMRVPGTINWPDEKKRKRGQQPSLAELVLWKSKRVYSLDRFTKAPMVQDATPATSGGGPEVHVSGNVRRITDLDGDLPDGVSQRAKVVIVQGHDPDQPLEGDNSRSEWLFFVCCELVRHDVPDEDIYAIITDPDYGISASVLDKGNSASVHRYAVRQIQRAKENAIDPWLAKLNGDYALVEDVGGRCRIAKEYYDPSLDQREVAFLQVDGFKTVYGNQFVSYLADNGNGGSSLKTEPVGKWWLRHPNRRTYSSVIFYPNKNFPGQLNLWRGFACDALPGDCSLFLNHVRKILCKNSPEHYDYLLGWMAHAVQRPHLPGETAIVMRGRQGTGKGTFAHMFGSLFGAHYKHITNAKHLLGNFNSQLQDACIVFADEAFNTQSKQHEAALKALITEPSIMVELKGIDAVPMRNCTHNIIAGNEDWIVPARLDDRRFFIVEVDDAHRRDTDYFEAMRRQMDNGGREALLHYLLNYDLAGYSIRKPPSTDELRRQQDHSMNEVEAFWHQRLLDGRLLPDHGGWRQEVLKDALVDAFQAETNTKHSHHQIKSRLGKFLAGVVRDRRLRRVKVQWITARGVQRTSANPWVWSFPSLAECRAWWDERFGARRWPIIEDEDDGEEQPLDGTDAF